MNAARQVIDPETGIQYAYRPDLSPEAPFESGGEFYTLNGVDEIEVFA